nr:MAG TPA: hypothetical protein [Caudoviricetes sp.]
MIWKQRYVFSLQTQALGITNLQLLFCSKWAHESTLAAGAGDICSGGKGGEK